MKVADFVSMLPYLVACLGTISAFVFGLVKRKTKKKLSQTEQETDVQHFMQNECIKVEKFSKSYCKTMTKAELSEYKKQTVLEKTKMYAMACGYEWYNEELGVNYITQIVEIANAISGKKDMSNQLDK